MCGLGYGLVYAGETRISGGLAAVIFGLLPLMTGVATFLAGTERPPARFFAGSLVALGGIAIIYADRMTASANQALGVALVFASVLVCAIYTIILKRHASDTDPLATNLPFLSAAALSLLLFAASYERQLPPWPPAVRPTVALLYLAVFGSVITFALYFYLLRRMSVTAASTLVFVEPVLALLIDAGFEREIRLGARSYAGAAVTLLGVAISLLLRPAALDDRAPRRISRRDENRRKPCLMAKCGDDPCQPPSSPPLYGRSLARAAGRGAAGAPIRPGRARRGPRGRAGAAGGELLGLEGHLPGRPPAPGDVQGRRLRTSSPSSPPGPTSVATASSSAPVRPPMNWVRRWSWRSSGGRAVVIKPHLEPLVHRPGYTRATSDNHSWRAECGWRGFFDVDPMTPDYREGVVLAGLRMLKAVHDRLAPDGIPAATPVRFDLGAELMNSVVEFPDRWGKLLAAARAERKRLGLDGRVLLSHNFSHHLQIPEDQVDRMSPAGRKALGRYISGLDAVALSQYMDLTVVVPAEERGKRLPTADEVAEALRRHERNFRQDILVKALGLKPGADPAVSRGRVRRRGGRPAPPQPVGSAGHRRAGEATSGGDRPRPRGAGPLPVAARGAHRPQRRVVGDRHPLRHLRLAQPRLRHPRGVVRHPGVPETMIAGRAGLALGLLLAAASRRTRG